MDFYFCDDFDALADAVGFLAERVVVVAFVVVAVFAAFAAVDGFVVERCVPSFAGAAFLAVAVLAGARFFGAAGSSVLDGERWVLV